MKSIVLKSGIIAAFFMVLHCDNPSVSTIHPRMILEVEKVNNTSRVIISTTVAKDYSMYRIIDDSCTVTYPWSMLQEDVGLINFIASVKIANNPAASQSGTFYGVWEVPDSLLIYGSLQIQACVQDEANHSVCASLML